MDSDYGSDIEATAMERRENANLCGACKQIRVKRELKSRIFKHEITEMQDAIVKFGPPLEVSLTDECAMCRVFASSLPLGSSNVVLYEPCFHFLLKLPKD
jgi:hypothetical protein